MARLVYYCTLKTYEGLLKKKTNMLHLFILPRTKDDYLYLGLLGEREEVSGTYGMVLITRIPNELLNIVLGGEKEYFGDRFEIVEQKKAKVKKIGMGIYLIKLLERSDIFLKPEIVLAYQEQESTPKKRIYNMTARLSLNVTHYVTSTSVKRKALATLIHTVGKKILKTFGNK